MKRCLVLVLLLCRLYATDHFVLCTCMKAGTIYMRDILKDATGRAPRCHHRGGDDVVFGYCHAGPFQRNCKVVYLYRDPRDVLVSYVHWAPKQRDADKWFGDQLPLFRAMTIKQRILYCLNLNNPQELKMSLADVPRRVQEAKEKPDHFFAISYEELVGSRGGGNNFLRKNALERLHQFLHMDQVTPRGLILIADRRYGPSDTYRRGQAGAWKGVFDEELKRAFKASPYGQFPVLLGYESNNEW